MDALRPRSADSWTPAIDVIETDDDVLVVVDLPGVEPDGVDVSLAGNMLTLQGDRPVSDHPEAATVHARERAQGRFNRSIPMPVPINPDGVSAESNCGVLQIRLPKAEHAKAQKIQVATPRKAATSGGE